MKLSLNLYFVLAGIIVALCSSDIRAESNVTEALHKADIISLSESKKWHALVHYYKPFFGDLISFVDDKNFFLSKQGKRNPKAELSATIESFFDDPRLGDEHAICLFPARFEWIREQLNLPLNIFPTPACETYEQWRAKVNAEQLTLVFPAAYINSPSSMFGHTLFRFDPKNIDAGTDWLSWSLSFGAVIDTEDNPFEFAYRAHFGGYPGMFAMMHYFEKIKEYNHLENRDIWEYELDINPSQVKEILRHAWELRDKRFDYFFLDENCAFRLLEYIELVKEDVSLTGQFTFTAIPVDTVRAIVEAELVKSASYKPSEVTKLKYRIAQLDNEQKQLAKSLSEGLAVLASTPYQSLDVQQKSELVQIAYSYMRYQQLGLPRDPQLAARSHELLLELNRLPRPNPINILAPDRPERGHNTQVLGLSSGVTEGQLYGQLLYRPTYHDLLDNPIGYPEGAQIAIANTEVRFLEEGEIELNRLDLIDISSLSAVDLFFGTPSWHVKTGYEDVYSNDTEGKGKVVGAYYLKAGIGFATKVTPSVLSYLLTDARVEHNVLYKPFIVGSLGVSAGVLAFNSWGSLKLSAETDYFNNDEYRVETIIEQNVPLSLDDAVRIKLSHEWHRGVDIYDASLTYRHYF